MLSSIRAIIAPKIFCLIEAVTAVPKTILTQVNVRHQLRSKVVRARAARRLGDTIAVEMLHLEIDELLDQLDQR